MVATRVRSRNHKFLLLDRTTTPGSPEDVSQQVPHLGEQIVPDCVDVRIVPAGENRDVPVARMVSRGPAPGEGR
jgi:hypothetical protein